MQHGAGTKRMSWLNELNVILCENPLEQYLSVYDPIDADMPEKQSFWNFHLRKWLLFIGKHLPKEWRQVSMTMT
ncbi:MAG: hypothetical protein CMK32_07915 [Porticoccaceae bacterium]|nr:hypothetical protein [Porticoccaceae bacterium]